MDDMTMTKMDGKSTQIAQSNKREEIVNVIKLPML